MEALSLLPPNTTQKLDAKGNKLVQKHVGRILYYAQMVSMTVLMALSSIVIEQTKVTEKTMARCMQVLDYLLGHADAKVRYHALDMIFNIHTNTSYLSEEKARSHMCGHFFMGWMPQDAKPIHLNGVFHVSTTILHFVVDSAAKAELGALHHNCQTRIVFQLTLAKMGHPQPRTPVHCGNATAAHITNKTIKRQCLRSIDMRFFWIGDRVAQEMYAPKWHPAQEKITDY